MTKTFARAVAVLAVAGMPLCAAMSGSAFAHKVDQTNTHGHDHAKLAKHGGEIVEIGSYDVEVVHVDSKIAVYVYDEHGNDISVNATKGDAIFVVAGASKKVALTPVGGRLEGPLDFATSPDDHLDVVLRLVISGKTQAGKAEIRLH